MGSRRWRGPARKRAIGCGRDVLASGNACRASWTRLSRTLLLATIVVCRRYERGAFCRTTRSPEVVGYGVRSRLNLQFLEHLSERGRRLQLLLRKLHLCGGGEVRGSDPSGTRPLSSRYRELHFRELASRSAEPPCRASAERPLSSHRSRCCQHLGSGRRQHLNELVAAPREVARLFGATALQLDVAQLAVRLRSAGPVRRPSRRGRSRATSRAAAAWIVPARCRLGHEPAIPSRGRGARAQRKGDCQQPNSADRRGCKAPTFHR